MASHSERRPRVVHRTDWFVGRTTNWLYDHLRYIPRHVPLIYCDHLANRAEFPLLDARGRDRQTLTRRAWRRFAAERLYPADARWLRRSRPALLHSHFGYVAVGDFRLRSFLDVPWLVSFYGADVYELGRQREWRDRYAPLFERATLVLALGPRMAEELKTLGCPKAKVAVHPLGVDVEAIPSRERVLEAGAPLKILFAGTFREKKGVEYVIRGAAEARGRGVRLEVTLVGDATPKPGDAETKEAIFREITRLGLQDVVTHHPYLEFDRLIQIALASHVFVAPSVTSANGDAEGTPFVLQQMMATGMPVIATVHSDIPYVVGELGDQLVPERDAGAIAARLEYYAAQPEQLAITGTKFRDRIRRAFDVRACAAQLSSVYDGLSGVIGGG